MSVAPERSRGLGRGLSALLGETGESRSRAHRLPIAQLRPNPRQPRRIFGEEELEALAESVRRQGVLQSVLVRPVPDAVDSYEIVAGERRWRAAQRAQLHEIPVQILEISDRDALEIALVENIQRADLNPLEEAEGYHRLIADFGHSQEAVAQAVGKSRSHVANMVRLLDLPAPVKTLIDQGELSMGHGRALLTARDPLALAKEVVIRALNVRQTESRVAREKGAPLAAKRSRDPNVAALEEELSVKLGLEVAIRVRGESGRLTIRYRTLDQLDDLLRRLTQPLAPEVN
ncbi:MAG: ParB/RepB/Spo0J family partition protein [Alphaproteobacteria bacterium]